MKNHTCVRFGMWASTSALLGFVFVLASAVAASVPPAVGDWQGKITAGDNSLRVVVHVTQDKDGKLSATLDSPDQGVNAIAVSSINFKEPDLHLEIARFASSYDGTISKDHSEITGQWKQGGASIPLTLQRASM